MTPLGSLGPEIGLAAYKGASELLVSYNSCGWFSLLFLCLLCGWWCLGAVSTNSPLSVITSVFLIQGRHLLRKGDPTPYRGPASRPAITPPVHSAVQHRAQLSVTNRKRMPIRDGQAPSLCLRTSATKGKRPTQSLPSPNHDQVLSTASAPSTDHCGTSHLNQADMLPVCLRIELML